MNIRLIFATAALAGLVTIASAQQPPAASHHGKHHSAAPAAAPADPHAGHSAAPSDNSPSSAACHQRQNACRKMHAEMNVPLTGDADADFVRNMIPHHQGAIDMAKTILAFGKDPELRKLAEAIIAAQDSEIALMKAWLAKTGK